jgi:hypothetical protein
MWVFEGVKYDEKLTPLKKRRIMKSPGERYRELVSGGGRDVGVSAFRHRSG